jgi:hypothetical protein
MSGNNKCRAMPDIREGGKKNIGAADGLRPLAAEFPKKPTAYPHDNQPENPDIVAATTATTATTANATHRLDFHTIRFYRNPSRSRFNTGQLVFDFYTRRCDLSALGTCLGCVSRGSFGSVLSESQQTCLRSWCCRQENQSYGNPGNSAHLALPLAGYHLMPGLNRHLPDERPDPLILK